jgi:hypothetical protein
MPWVFCGRPCLSSAIPVTVILFYGEDDLALFLSCIDWTIQSITSQPSLFTFALYFLPHFPLFLSDHPVPHGMAFVLQPFLYTLSLIPCAFCSLDPSAQVQAKGHLDSGQYPDWVWVESWIEGKE